VTSTVDGAQTRRCACLGHRPLPERSIENLPLVGALDRDVR